MLGRGEGGHLEVLQWARENECPWDETRARRRRGGHLEVPQWALERVPVGRKTARPRRGRAPRGVAVGASNGCRWNGDVRGRGGGGPPEVLQWARQNGCPWDEDTCEAAAREGTRGAAVAGQNGCPVPSARAAKAGTSRTGARER